MGRFFMAALMAVFVAISEDQAGPFGYYPTYGEIDSLLDELQNNYPHIVKRIALTPRTIEGRDIFAVKVSNSPNEDNHKPENLIIGVQHAYEPIGAAIIRNDLMYLCEHYGTDPEVTWLVDNRQMYFVPICNPDGYVYIENGGPADWRKNRRLNGDGTYGVDLNRNFPFKWGYDDRNSSPNTNAVNYRGTAPLSEPETQALVAFVNTRTFRTWQNHHSPNDVLVYPFGYDYTVPLPRRDSLAYYTMAEGQQAHYGRFTAWGPSHIVYNGWATNGSSEDWGWSDSATYRIYCIISEVGKDYWETDAEAKEVCDRMLGADLYMARCAGFYPVITRITVMDTGAGCNNDGILNPGETVSLQLQIKNKAVVDTTEDVTASLSSSSQYVTILDSTGVYGNMEMLEERVNSGDPFIFSSRQAAGRGASIPFRVRVTWNLNGIAYEKSLLCTLQTGEPVALEPRKTNSDGLNAAVVSHTAQRIVSFLVHTPGQWKENPLTVHIYHSSGRKCKMITRTGYKPREVITWDGCNAGGQKAESGIYFAVLEVNGAAQVLKFILTP